MSSCLRPSDFQRYLEEADSAVGSHLAACQNCRAAFDRVAATNQRVDTWLSSLASPVEHAPLDVTGVLAGVAGRQPVDRLANLLAQEFIDIPWYLSLYRNVRDGIRPAKVPVLNITSRPVAVTDIWGLYARDLKSRFAAIAIHAAVFALLMVGATNKTVRESVQDRFDLIDPTIRPYVPEKAQGGGGGGAREPVRVSAGQAPKPSLKAFVPPRVVDHPPILPMEPSIVAPPDTVTPQSNLQNWGDPLAKLSSLSNGSGFSGGMGTGNGNGLGAGKGSGLGPGDGGGTGGAIFNPGGSVSAPVAVFKPEPEYSEEARKAKYGGIVMLSVVVDTEGRTRDIHVAKSLGMGLDEKAIEAVQKWKFRPGMRNGQPVNVRATIEVSFRLL